MLRYVKQNIFNSPAQVIVNTVNTVGVMGKGIAKEYKNYYPEMFEKYRYFCEKEMLSIGQLWLYKTPNKWVLNFPTKKHWRNPSELEFIELGLKKFVNSYEALNIKSISFPQLGVGNGGLDWDNEVRPLMEKYLSPLPIDVFIHIYNSKNASDKEHLNQDDMKKWLNSSPTLLSFKEVKYDIEALLFRDGDFSQLLIDNEKVTVYPLVGNDQQDNIALVFHYLNEDKYKPIYYDDFFEFWSVLRSQGFISTKDLTKDKLKIYKEIYTVFNLLPYLEIIKSYETYSKKDSEISELILTFLPTKIEDVNIQEVVSHGR